MSRHSSRRLKRSQPAASVAANYANVPQHSGLLPLGALAAGFGLAMPMMVWAQTADPVESADETTLAAVKAKARVEFEDKKNVQAVTTTIGRGTQDIRDVPQSLNVITERLLDDRKIDTLNEALRLSAGVTFSAAENGTQQDFFIRGFSVAQVGDLLIDGMKDPSQYDRDTFNYDRIEVLRGSASMVFGRGSTGGVVNQVTKKPLLADLKEVTATIGTGDYGRATTDFNMRTSEHTALRINGMYTKADNYGAKIDKKGIAPSFSFGLGTADEFNIGLFYLKVDNRPMSGTPYAMVTQFYDAVNPNDYYGAASDFLKGEAKYGTVHHTHHFDDGGELRTQVRTGKFDRSQWYSTYRLPNGVATVDDSTVITRSGLTPRKDQYTGTYLQSDYSNKLEWFGMQHSILGGVDAARETAGRYVNNTAATTLPTSASTRGNSTIGTPDDGYRSLITLAWIPSNNYVSKNAGIFVQDLVEFVPHWKLLLGIREDYIKGDFTNIIAGVGTNATLEDAMTSYRGGLIYQPTSTLSFHLAYGTSFNTSGDTYQFTGIIDRSAQTPPEKSRNIELGAKLDWFDGNLSTRLALFNTEKYNERTTDADFSGTTYTLSGKRHSRGVELEVAGRPTQAVEVYLSYAYIPSSTIDIAGNNGVGAGEPFGLLPLNSGSAWVTYQATKALRVGAGVTASSTNYAINGTSPTRALNARAPSYATMDALVEYFFTPDLYLQLNGANITDKVYARDLYRGFTVLGPGRNVKLTLGYTF